MVDTTVRWREHYPRVALILLVVRHAGNLLRLRPRTLGIFVFGFVSIGVRRRRHNSIGISSILVVVAIVRIVTEVDVQIDLIDLWPSEVRHVMVMLVLQTLIAFVLIRLQDSRRYFTVFELASLFGRLLLFAGRRLV